MADVTGRRFRAAVLGRAGGPVTVEEVEIGAFGPKDVLVRMGASGLCHTDVEVMQGTYANPLPAVLGHEGAGTVELVGAAVTSTRPGDRVVCSWQPACGRCFYCDRDDPILCQDVARGHSSGGLTDGQTRLLLRGKQLHHQMTVSSHAEYCILPEDGVVPVPADLPLDRGCLLGCGVQTGVGAATNVASVDLDSSVVVIGCGAVGLNVIQGARLRRAEKIVAVDTDPARLKQAAVFGATHMVHTATDEVDSAILRLTAGRGADVVFEAAGNERAMQLAFECARRGGQIVLLGKIPFDRPLAIRFGSMAGEKRIVRSSYGGARPRRDFPLLARLYLSGHLLLDELITRRIRLDEVADGLRAVGARETLRTVVTFDSTTQAAE